MERDGNKSNDINLFKYLKIYCEQYGETVDSLNEKLKENAQRETKRWEYIASEINWRGSVAMLQK